MILYPLFIILLGNSPAILAITCPNGSEWKDDLGYCLLPINTEVNYSAATKACGKVGGHLISIHNLFENILLSAYVDEYFPKTKTSWLGMHADQFQVWGWDDTSKWDYEHWAKQEPFDGNYCAQLHLNDQLWHSADCDEDKAAFLCGIQPQTTDSTTPAITTKWPGKCPTEWSYFDKTNACYYIGANMSWTDGETYCRSQHSHLASVHSFEENQFILDLKYTTNCDVVANDWISITLLGSYRDYHDQTWLWSDGTPFDYAPDLCNDEFGRHFMIDNTKCSMCQNGTWFSVLSDYDNSIYPFFACKFVL
ncbi:unnamed protein product, partial [Mesorhabditis spiculigera]